MKHELLMLLCDVVMAAGYLTAGATVFCALTRRGWWA